MHRMVVVQMLRIVVRVRHSDEILLCNRWHRVRKHNKPTQRGVDEELTVVDEARQSHAFCGGGDTPHDSTVRFSSTKHQPSSNKAHRATCMAPKSILANAALSQHHARTAHPMMPDLPDLASFCRLLLQKIAKNAFFSRGDRYPITTNNNNNLGS